MNKISNAIIMAAGIGKRMHPITLSTPKPLVEVNGVKMIDSVVNALNKNGINNIYVVVGYLKEQFYDWAKNKNGITLIENPYFQSCNNISSLYVARKFIGDTIILDGDQIIYNPEILKTTFDYSGYCAFDINTPTDEWVLQKDQNNFITSCSRTGGSSGSQLLSVSRWTNEDGEKLAAYLELEFIQKENTQIYWDDIALFCHPNDFKLRVYPINREDIIEIDNYSELISLDNSYIQNQKEI